MGVIALQADNPTPDGGSFNGGGPQNIQWSGSLLGFQYDFRSGRVKFNPAKNFTLGLQALVGAEVSWNSDLYKKAILSNTLCGYYGSH